MIYAFPLAFTFAFKGENSVLFQLPVNKSPPPPPPSPPATTTTTATTITTRTKAIKC